MHLSRLLLAAALAGTAWAQPVSPAAPEESTSSPSAESVAQPASSPAPAGAAEQPAASPSSPPEAAPAEENDRYADLREAGRSAKTSEGGPQSTVQPEDAPKVRWRRRFGGPTQGNFRTGTDEGVGLGSTLPDPTAFEGANRTEPVLQGNRFYNNLTLNAHAGAYIGDKNSRLLLTASAGLSLLGADLDYSFKAFDAPGFFSAYASMTQSENGAFAKGDLKVNLPRGRGVPYLYRNVLGAGYTVPVDDHLTLSSAIMFEDLSIHDGLFAGTQRPPYDTFRQPLLVSRGGHDNYMLARSSGLYFDVDDLQFPTEGTKFRFQVDQGVSVGATSFEFTRLAVNYTYFLPTHFFGDKTEDIIFNLQGATARGTLPPYEAYSMGGAGGVRAFDVGELGTGKSFIQATAEYRAPLGNLDVFGSSIPLKAVTFVDYGTVLGTQSQVYGQPGIVRGKLDSAWAVGGGLHARTDIGLARVEGAYGQDGHWGAYFVIGDRY